MTISSTANKVTLFGNGVTTVWPFKFRVPAQSQMSVIVTDSLGNQTTLTAAQYTVTGIGNQNGGSVTYPLAGSPLAALWSITILRTLPLVQQTDIVNQDGFFPDVLESTVDYLTMVDQQLSEAQARALALAVTDISGAGAYRANSNRISGVGYPASDTDAATQGSARDIGEALTAGVVGGYGYFLQNGTGAVGQTFQQKMRRWVDAEDFGWPTVEAGLAMNRAIAAAVANGVGVVRFSSPHYNQQTPIVLQNGIVIEGPGRGPEGEIRVAAGVAIDAQIQTPDFEATYVSKPGSALNGSIRDAGFRRLFLNGNKANVPAVTDWRKGMGFRCYWHRPVIEDVAISSTPGIGFISAYPSNGRTFPDGYQFAANLVIDAKDRGVSGIYVYDTGYEGGIWEGPSDMRVDRVFVGWPENSLQSNVYDSTKQSLKFTQGPVVALRQLNGGTGYTTATVSITTATGSGFVGTCVVSGGAVARIIVNAEGYAYQRTDTVVIAGDGTGAQFALHVDDTVDGFVVNNDGCELGFVHAFNNAQGWAVNFRNDSSNFPRIKGDFVMGETSWGNVRIGGHCRYQIARIDVHYNGNGGGPAVLPSLMVRSDRGGSIATFEDYRDSSTNNGSPSVLIAGSNNHVLGGAIFGRGQAGDGVVLGGQQNVAKFGCTGVGGAALVTEYGVVGCIAEVDSSLNSVAWRNEDASATGIGTPVKISNSYIGTPGQFSGLTNLSSAQWKQVSIESTRTDVSTRLYSQQTVFGSADATLTTEQTIVINHNIVRTPQVSDCSVSVSPNFGASPAPLVYAYVSATSSTQITVKLKYSAAGTGTATVQVRIG